MSCFESSTFTKNPGIMSVAILEQACIKLGWNYSLVKDELTVHNLNDGDDFKGEFALKVVGNIVTYNSFYIRNANTELTKLRTVFYDLNIAYSEESIIKEFKKQGWTYKSNDQFRPNNEEKVSFFMIGRSKLKDETEPVARIRFTILKDGSFKTDSDYIPKDIHELADLAMAELERLMGSSRVIEPKQIPLKYKHKTFCQNKKTISITKK